MQLVPFDEKWAGSETKLDLKGWYRRPSRHGGFSVVGPFPLRRHLDYARKGFEFITLASAEDVAPVRMQLKMRGIDLNALADAYDHNGHFKMEQYLKDERGKDDAFAAELQAKVDRFGADAVSEMMRLQDPAFVMPESVKIPEAKGKK